MIYNVVLELNNHLVCFEREIKDRNRDRARVKENEEHFREGMRS